MRNHAVWYYPCKPVDIRLPIEKQIDLIWNTSYLGNCNNEYANTLAATKKEIIRVPLIEILSPEYPENHLLLEYTVKNGYYFNADIEQINCADNGDILTMRNRGYGILKGNFLTGVMGNVVSITY
jgi:hypothetical protein